MITSIFLIWGIQTSCIDGYTWPPTIRKSSKKPVRSETSLFSFQYFPCGHFSWLSSPLWGIIIFDRAKIYFNNWVHTIGGDKTPELQNELAGWVIGLDDLSSLWKRLQDHHETEENRFNFPKMFDRGKCSNTFSGCTTSQSHTIFRDGLPTLDWKLSKNECSKIRMKYKYIVYKYIVYKYIIYSYLNSTLAHYRYTQYEVIGDNGFSKTAALDQRYTETSLRAIILDVHFLSQCDYLVCTFSSQVL